MRRLVPFRLTLTPTLAKVFRVTRRQPEPPPVEVLAIAGRRLIEDDTSPSPMEAAQLLLRAEPRATVAEGDLALAIVGEMTKRPSRPSGNPGAQADAILRALVAHAKGLVTSGDVGSVSDAVARTLGGVWGRNAAQRWEGLSGAAMDAEALGALVVAALQSA